MEDVEWCRVLETAAWWGLARVADATVEDAIRVAIFAWL